MGPAFVDIILDSSLLAYYYFDFSAFSTVIFPRQNAFIWTLIFALFSTII